MSNGSLSDKENISDQEDLVNVDLHSFLETDEKVLANDDQEFSNVNLGQQKRK